MKMTKFKIRILISVIITLIITISISYAYFAVSITGGTASSTYTTTLKPLASATFDAGESASMNIYPGDMLQSACANDYTSVGNSGMLYLRGQINNSEDGGTTVCTYSIIYTPTTTYVPTQTTYYEYTIEGNASSVDATLLPHDSNGNTSVGVTNLGNVSSPITLVNGATMTTSEEIGTMEWIFTFKYYNLCVNQNAKAGTSASGTVSFDSVSCTTTG